MNGSSCDILTHTLPSSLTPIRCAIPLGDGAGGNIIVSPLDHDGVPGGVKFNGRIIGDAAMLEGPNNGGVAKGRHGGFGISEWGGRNPHCVEGLIIGCTGAVSGKECCC